MRLQLIRAIALSAIGVLTLIPAAAQTAVSDPRVVFANANALARQLDDASRDGLRCQLLARPDAGVVVPGVVAIVAREGGPPRPVAHRVVVAAASGADLEQQLDAAGADGFELCGVVLDEETRPRLVAILTRTSDQPPTAIDYGVEVLTNDKASLERLNARGRESARVVAATAIDNNRVADMRSWLVVTRRSSRENGARDMFVRSDSGPTGLQKALNEQTARGYRIDQIWKEGKDAVAMMSRSAGAAATPDYLVETMPFARFHFLGHAYVFDMPYLSGDDRLVVSDGGVSASNDIEDDPLPRLGSLGYAQGSAIDILGNHVGRHHGFVPVSARIHRGGNGALLLMTVVTQVNR